MTKQIFKSFKHKVMSANAIDNSNLKNYRDDQGTTGFVPSVTYDYDAAAKEVDVTNDSTLPSGATLDKVIVKVHDKFGGEARGFILPVDGSDSGHDGDTTINVAALDASKGLDITATVLGNRTASGQLVADGGAYDIGEAGSLGSWDVQKNA